MTSIPNRVCASCLKMFSPKKADPRVKFCSKTCRQKDVNSRFKENNPKYHDLYYEKSKDGYFWRSMRTRAKKLGVEFSLTLEEYQTLLKEATHCPVFGFPLERNTGPGGWKFNSPSLDRFDSKKGYTLDNVSVISAKANRLKNDATLEEIETIAAWMRAKSVDKANDSG